MEPTKNPAPAAQPAKAATLSEARKQVLAQHFMATPVDRRGALLAHFREYGPRDETEFLEKLANSRN